MSSWTQNLKKLTAQIPVSNISAEPYPQYVPTEAENFFGSVFQLASQGNPNPTWTPGHSPKQKSSPIPFLVIAGLLIYYYSR